MPESPSGGEKTELPTPKRMQDARQDGQVGFSSEVNIAGLLFVGFAVLAVTAPFFWQTLFTTTHGVAPSYGGLRVSRVKSVPPSACRSERWSMSPSPCACSGDMYDGVPMPMPVLVLAQSICAC